MRVALLLAFAASSALAEEPKLEGLWAIDTPEGLSFHIFRESRTVFSRIDKATGTITLSVLGGYTFDRQNSVLRIQNVFVSEAAKGWANQKSRWKIRFGEGGDTFTQGSEKGDAWVRRDCPAPDALDLPEHFKAAASPVDGVWISRRESGEVTILILDFGRSCRTDGNEHTGRISSQQIGVFAFDKEASKLIERPIYATAGAAAETETAVIKFDWQKMVTKIDGKPVTWNRSR